MTDERSRTTMDEFRMAVESVAEQLKILVSAVDDLRCEVEWQARNLASAECQPESAAPPAATFSEKQADNVDEAVADATRVASPDDSLLTAAGRLQAYEHVLRQSPRGVWRDAWDEAEEWDVVELPVGRVFAVCPDLAEVILGVRPAHVVGGGCDCEADIGAPYLLVWQSETEFFVRELSEEEARRLQELCLAAQAEQADKVTRQAAANVQSQLGLF